MPDPYSYSSERLDRLIEQFREAQGTDEYAEARTALWREIQDAMEWARVNGFRQGQQVLIKGLKQYIEGTGI